MTQQRLLTLLTAGAALLAARRGDGVERKVLRETALRAGPGAYYESLAPLRRGSTVDTGREQGAWLEGRLSTATGWVARMAFEAPKRGIDYSGLLGAETAGMVEVSSVDIAAATKGAIAARYASKGVANADVAAQLEACVASPRLADQIRATLTGKDSEILLGRLPHRTFENSIVLRPDAEAVLGQALAAHLAPNGLEEGPVVEYVNAVAALVGACTERYDLGYRVGILKDNTVNGFGLPGGYVLLTRGLLKAIRDEGELACVVGHEMAHASLYHGLREFKKRAVHRKRDAAFAELEEVTGTEEGAEGDLERLADTAYLTIIGGRAREDEVEADLYGVAYAAAAGYDPRAMVNLLGRIGGASEGADNFRHHPSLSARIVKIEKDVAHYRLSWAGQQRLPDRFRSMTGQAGADAQAPEQK